MSLVTPDLARTQAREFFGLLFGEDAPGYLCIWTPEKSVWVAANDLDEAAAASILLAEQTNAYFAIGLHPTALTATARGEAAHVNAIPGAWLDVDFGAEGHKKANLPPTIEDALGLIRSFPLHPTALVLTGHGLHGHWAFRELWTFRSDQERDEAQDLVYRFQATIRAEAERRGWVLDSTHSLAQVLRAPGTWNRKPGQEPFRVQLVEQDADNRFSPDEIEPFLLDVAWAANNAAAVARVSIPKELHEVDVDELPVSDRIKALIRTGPDQERHESRSEAGWAVMRAMVKAGCDDGVIASVFLDDDYRIGEKVRERGRGKKWLAAEIARARTKPEKKWPAIDLAHGIRPAVAPAAYRAAPQSTNGSVHTEEPPPVEGGTPPPPDEPDTDAGHAARPELPEIIVTNRPLRDISGDSLAAVIDANNPPSIFVRSGDLTRVRVDELGRPIIEALGESHLRGAMARTANFYRIIAEKVKDKATGEARKEFRASHVSPPLDVVRDALAIGSWGVPPLEAVVEAPTLRPDGSILDTPGYDPATRLVYHPSSTLSVPRVPERPSPEQIAAAVALLDEATGEFPYADQHSKANALGMLLTPIIRSAILGHAPLALIDKPRAGTGASLLADVTAIIATGRTAGMMAAPRSEEEWQKSILAILLSGSTVITIDNVEHQLASASLAIALTTTSYEGRVLGKNIVLRVPQRATWITTGNNIRLGGDLPRRCYWIRLDAASERPWERSGFKHPNLIGWASEHRGELLGALLTLARGWYAAGKPAANVPIIGSFEPWAETVGGILTFAGIEGFLGNLTALWDQADESANQWGAFLLAWFRVFGAEPVTVARICTALCQKDSNTQAMRDVVPEEIAGALGDPVLGEDGEIKPAGPGFRRKLGRALEKRADAVYGDYQLKRTGADGHTKATLWKVVAVSPAVSPEPEELPF